MAFGSILALALLLSGFAEAAPIEPCQSITVQEHYALNNLSLLVGWTLAGAAVSDDELDVTCNNVNATSHGKWTQEGLNQALIQSVTCAASHSQPNATTALPYVIQHSTEVFVTQLLHAFPQNETSVYEYLCHNLRYLSIDGFRLDSTRIIQATCNRAGMRPSPRPEGALPGVGIDFTASSIFLNTISTLYAMIFASAATSDTQLNIYCAHAGNYVASINTLLLNGTLVKETICDVKEPLSVESATVLFKSLSSQAFATVLEHASNVQNYTTWLVDNVDVASMNDVGLDGQAVLRHISGEE
ncbi:hypothetical protein LTR86_001889 [Recurvomyces mirabilis]|nr:hypothetical protein LTR86_001889 [Recurvomyces mirabilis]